jgi:hypothetical protein
MAALIGKPAALVGRSSRGGLKPFSSSAKVMP